MSTLADRFLDAAETYAANRIEQMELDRPFMEYIASPSSLFTGIPNRVTNPMKLLEQDTDWSWVAGDKIAKSMAEVPYGLYRRTRDGDQLITDHRIYERLANPAPGVTWSEHCYLTGKAFVTLGQAYWYKVVNVFKEPIWTYFMYPEYGQVEVKKNAFGAVMHYLLHRGYSKPETIQPEFMSHFRYWNLSSSTYGRGPMSAMPHMVELDMRIKKFMNRFVRNGLSQSGYFKPVREYSRPARQEFKDSIKEDLTGEENAGKFMLLPYDMEFKESQLSPRDVQFAQLFPIVRDQLMQTFGIPKSVAGISEATNRADAEAGIYVYLRFCVTPYLTMLQQFVQMAIVDPIDPQVVFKFDSVIPTDTRALAELNEIYIRSSQRTPNEARAMDDRTPMAGGDDLYCATGMQRLKDVGNSEGGRV